MSHASWNGSDVAIDERHALPARTAAEMESLLAHLLAAIESERVEDCPGCGGSRHYRWGRAGEAAPQRWRCRGCGRTFTARTGTLGAGLHGPNNLRLLLRDMLTEQPSSCRRLAAKLGIDKSTIWDWRRKINDWLLARRETAPVLLDHSAEIVRESRKASREWVDHQRDPATFPEPDRLRWVDYRRRQLALPQPMTPYLVPVTIGADHQGACHASLPSAASAMAHRPAPVGAGATLIGRLAAAFKRFIRPFRGPATRHLAGYVAWFVVRARAGLGFAELAAARSSAAREALGRRPAAAAYGSPRLEARHG